MDKHSSPTGPIALQGFIDHLVQYVSLSPQDIAFIEQHVQVIRVKRGEFLLKEGQVSQAFYFNLSGFVRLYYLQEGEEKTAYFYNPGDYISAYASFVKQIPSQFFLQASRDSELVVIGREASVKLLEYDSKFEFLARIAMEEELISQQEIIASLLTLRPEQRYQELLRKNPQIFQQIPQIQIASFLGVQPETLSRIKKRLAQKS